MKPDLPVFQSATAILPDRLLPEACIMVRDGVIEKVKPGLRPPKNATVIDAKGGYLSPGYIDVHVHGGGGADFMDGQAEAVRTACQVHARHGTTTIFPTTTTGSPEEIQAMIV